ncbi:transporter [Lithospermum erythrorhizon]|uniref:Transporter n=1 Tax=Lithospermum erythrorhizon TaxID=34254 RepID=A0AAV3R467_LITER
MAYRRCITARTKLLYQQQRFTPSFSYINHDDDNNNKNVECPNYSLGERRSFQGQMFSSPFHSMGGAYGSVFSRNMSTSVAEKGEMMTNVDVFVDGSLAEVTAQVAPAMNEVAVAAADSFLPVAALQYLIEHVHVFTGLNWWASIALTTFFIRCCTIPLTINQLKATSKFTLLRPKLEEVNQEMKDRGMCPIAVTEGQAKMQALFKEYKVTPFTPLKGLLIQGPVFVCFFLAVQNMAEKVPSFQHGGTSWFLDLTTPDTMYILPVLTALTFWITVEFNMQDGMEGNPNAKIIKNVSRVFAALTVPLTASFAKAIFCYWITANVFSLMYGMVIKKPEVKKFLGIPIIPVTPPSPTNNQQSGFSFFDAIKKYAAAQAEAQKNAQIKQTQQQSLASASPTESSKGMTQKIPSTAILSQKIRSLEKQVKGRKRGGKKNR